MSLERLIGELLRQQGWTVSVAESCTGGRVSDRLTNIAGSSDYFEGGVVSYSNAAKSKHLSIPPRYIEHHGAVSPQVAGRMAEGVRNAFDTAFGLSTTGIAGPGGGTKKTPVGRVFFGISDGKKTLVGKETFVGSRLAVKKAAAERMLEWFHDYLLKKSKAPLLFSLSPRGKGGVKGHSAGSFQRDGRIRPKKPDA